MADGTSSSVSGKGSVPSSPSIPLSSVLDVSMSHVICSVRSITKKLSLRQPFQPFSTFCVFQNLDTGKMIKW